MNSPAIPGVIIVSLFGRVSGNPVYIVTSLSVSISHLIYFLILNF